mgnify:FL=1
MTTPTILVPGKLDAAAKRIWSGVATQEELRELGAADVIAIKSDLEHMRVRYVSTASGRATRAVGSKGSGNEDVSRSVDHVASDETPDRMGDIIRVAGWDLTDFKNNPMLLWMHNHEHPIGRVLSAKKGKADDGRKALLTTSRIHEDDKSLGGLSNEVLLRMVQDGDLPAVSVGFQPLETYRPESEEERIKLGLGPWGVVFPAASLLELSVVAIGANQNALKRGLEKAVAENRLSDRNFELVLAEIGKAINGEQPVRTVHALGGLERAMRVALAKSDEGFEPAAPEPAAPDATDAPAESEPATEPVAKQSEAPAQPAPDPMERLAALVERLDGTLRANAEAQTKLGGVLATLSTRLDEISRAAGAVATEPEAAPGDGSPAGAGASPESRSASSEDFYAAVLDPAVNAVRAVLAKKN